MDHTESFFLQIGGVFVTPVQDMAEKLKSIKAFVFDWDGVFNNAGKNENKSSTFNEADSMGTNMLRFSHYLLTGQLPATAIISGEKNGMAFYFAEREHFDGCYFKVAHKTHALKHFCEQRGITEKEVCYVFDDVLDLGIAEICGLRMLINRKANPLFKNYVVKRNYADYITGHESGNFAVREACELLIGLRGNYDTCLDERKDFSERYATYLSTRQSLPTSYFTVADGKINAVNWSSDSGS